MRSLTPAPHYALMRCSTGEGGHFIPRTFSTVGCCCVAAISVDASHQELSHWQGAHGRNKEAAGGGAVGVWTRDSAQRAHREHAAGARSVHSRECSEERDRALYPLLLPLLLLLPLPRPHPFCLHHQLFSLSLSLSLFARRTPFQRILRGRRRMRCPLCCGPRSRSRPSY